VLEIRGKFRRYPKSKIKTLARSSAFAIYRGNFIDFMSQHRSLRAAATLGGKRNVLKRFERVELLKKRGQWKAGDRITGLRKTKPEA
jgi:small basic protein (TIGR04137 family)